MKKRQRMIGYILIFICCAIVFPSAIQAADQDGMFAPYLEEEEITLALGFSDYNIENVMYGKVISAVSSNPDIASVTESGVISPKMAGDAVITLMAAGERDISQRIFTLTCTVHVVEVSLAPKEVSICLNKEYSASIFLNGGDALNISTVDYYLENGEIASVYYNYPDINHITIYALAAGNTTLVIKMDDKEFRCKIKVVSYVLNKPTLILMKGRTGTLKVTGTKEKVKWKSENRKIATVSSKGVVKAKGKGTTVITAAIKGDIILRCYVSVASDAAVKAVKKAKSVIGSTYSQAKRMETGYYDCSSLIWRSYRPYGVTLGNQTWAPTAAEQARWCVSNHKVLANKAIRTKSLKLLPGDLIFYTSGDNGRYKNIYHVAMFAGYQEYRYTPDETVLMGIMVEADGRIVALHPYIEDYGEGKKIVMIARPV